MLFRWTIFLVMLLFASCRGDFRKAQWHYHAIVVQQNDIAEVMGRLENGFSDSLSYRAVNEKIDSLHLLANRLESTLDTLSVPDEDDRLKEVSKHWAGILKKEVFPLYSEKINLWKMMHLMHQPKDDMRIKEITDKIENKKGELNAQMTGVIEEFVQDYGLSYKPE